MGSNGLIAVIAALPQEPRRPRLVCYTADGDRTELSGASLANWTAKVAGLLRDELGLVPGGLAAVLAASGWQVAPVLLGCWWAGLTVTDTDDPSAAVAFVSAGDDAAAEEVFVLSDHPLGAPVTGIAAHHNDFTSAVLPHSDRLGTPARADDGWACARAGGTSVTVRDLLARAEVAAAAVRERTTPGARPVLLATRPWTVPDGIAQTLLAALAADGTLVQCPAGISEVDLARVARAENVTATIGTRPSDLPHLDR